MMLDDLARDGVELPVLTDGTDAKQWVNRVFWTWYFLHSNEEILGFSILGIHLKRWRWKDLHGAFLRVFGPQPAELEPPATQE